MKKLIAVIVATSFAVCAGSGLAATDTDKTQATKTHKVVKKHRTKRPTSHPSATSKSEKKQ